MGAPGQEHWGSLPGGLTWQTRAPAVPVPRAGFVGVFPARDAAPCSPSDLTCPSLTVTPNQVLHGTHTQRLKDRSADAGRPAEAPLPGSQPAPSVGSGLWRPRDWVQARAPQEEPLASCVGDSYSQKWPFESSLSGLFDHSLRCLVDCEPLTRETCLGRRSPRARGTGTCVSCWIRPRAVVTISSMLMIKIPPDTAAGWRKPFPRAGTGTSLTRSGNLLVMLRLLGNMPESDFMATAQSLEKITVYAFVRHVYLNNYVTLSKQRLWWGHQPLKCCDSSVLPG